MDAHLRFGALNRTPWSGASAGPCFQRELCPLRTRKRILRYSTEDSRGTMLPTTRHAPEGESRLENKSRGFDLSIFQWRETEMRSPLETVRAMTKARVHARLPCKRKKLELPGGFFVYGTMLMSNAVSLIATEKGGFVYRTESFI